MKALSLALLAGMLTVGLSGRAALGVIGGEVDTAGKFSNVGAYVVVSQKGVPIEPYTFGSGTLVHPRVFLTAGHISSVAEGVIAAGLFDVGDARISFGTDRLDPDSWHEIEAIVTHPDFRVNGIVGDDGDVGAVILKEPGTDIDPVTLAPVGYLDWLRKSGALRDARSLLTVVGYGDDRSFPPAEGVTTDGLRRFAEAVLGGVTAKWVSVQQNAMAHEGGVNNGDSGGPAFWVDPVRGERVQVGIASWTIDAALARFVRVDLASVRDFIDAVVDEVEAADAEALAARR